MGLFDFITKPIGLAVGGITKGLSAGAPQNNFRATPYAYDTKAFGPNANNQELTQEQMEFIKALRNQSMNPSQSVGVAQANQMRDSNIASSNAMANSAVGINPALAYREAQIQNEKANEEAAQKGLIAALQERNANYGTLNSAFNSGLTNQNVQEANQIKLQEDKAAENGRQDTINSGIAASNFQQGQKQAGGILSGLGSIGGMISGGGMGGGGGQITDVGSQAPELASMSDETEKKDVRKEASTPEGDSDLYDFLNNLKAYSYQYKNPKAAGAGEGTYWSPMAQDLEKSRVGDSMVKESSSGKMVDYGKGFGAILAAQSQLHERLKRLEGGSK